MASKAGTRPKKRRKRRLWSILDVPFFLAVHEIERIYAREHGVKITDEQRTLFFEHALSDRLPAYAQWRLDPLRDVPIREQIRRALGMHPSPLDVEIAALVANIIDPAKGRDLD